MRSYIFPVLFLLCACTQTTETKPNEEEPKPIEVDSTELVIEPDGSAEDELTPMDSDEISEVVSEEYVDIDWLEYEKSLMKDFSFVIIISTKSYDAALNRAKEASEKLGYPLDLRGLHPNDEMGLSLPREVCEAICGGDIVDYPQYLPRNDYGESKYVSVEYSNGFKGFTKGYYIVVVASGEKGDPIIKEAVEESKKYYKDAYAKTCGVWMGCGC